MEMAGPAGVSERYGVDVHVCIELVGVREQVRVVARNMYEGGMGRLGLGGGYSLLSANVW